MSRLRIIAAFIVAPLMTPLTFVVTVVSRTSFVKSPADILVVFLLYAPFAYLAAAIFGIPLFLLLRSSPLNNAFAYLVGGAIIGLTSGVIVTRLLAGWSVASGDIVWCAIAGAVSTFVFWLIIRGAPASCCRWIEQGDET